MKNKIFIICPVTIATEHDIRVIEEYATILERDNNLVHIPHRDTNQFGTSLEINTQNLNAIKEADEVHILYNNQSKGIHFDMGVAFALNKKIQVVQYKIDGEYIWPDQFDDECKSYHKFLHEYETITSNFK